MIFVTVGTDGPFDRLVKTVDEWAGQTGRGDVFAQIGASHLQPRFLRFASFLEPPTFARYFRAASLVISHAGMGTILTALQYSKPILVMPRLASRGEQRNEHQLATARHMESSKKLAVAFDEEQLRAQLTDLDAITARSGIGPYAQPELIAAIRTFIGASPADAKLLIRQEGLP